MKRLNQSLLAAVAVLAITLTAFTRADSMAKRINVNNCYRNVTTQFTAACIPSVVNLAPSSTCALAMAQVGKKVSAVSNFFANLECDEVQNFFCCAQLIVDTNPCPGQARLTFVAADRTPQVNQFARISAVYCKSTMN